MNRKVMLLGMSLLMLCGGLAHWSRSAEAQNVPAAPQVRSPVAVLDVVRVFNECAQINDLNVKMSKRAADMQAELDARKETIDIKTKELEAFPPGSADFLQRRRELTQLQVESTVWLKTTDEELEEEKYRWTKIIYEKSVAIARLIAGEQGYAVVLQTSKFEPPLDKNKKESRDVSALRQIIQDQSVLYHVDQVDMTDLVIQKLDAEYQTSQTQAAAAGGPSAVNP